VLNILIFGGILVQALIYRRQWALMQQGLRETREFMQYSHSAYLTIQSVSLNKWDVGDRVEVALKLVNAGTTPAYEVRIYGHISQKAVPFEFARDTALNIGGEIPGRGIIGPNGDTSHQLLYSKDAVNDEMITKEKSNPLHVWGIIIYCDIFKRERWTEFCYVRQPNSVQFAVSPNNNQADAI
jgi:hypothetical protein